MSNERLENTASVPLTIEHREERILTPIHHSIVIGMSWTVATMLLLLTLAIAVAETTSLREGTMTMMILVSLAAGVVTFVWAYVKRDAWLRESTSLLNMTSDLEELSRVHSPNVTTPVAPASPGVDDLLRVSGSLIIRLRIPPELGITDQSIMDLAVRISQGALTWSRRSLKGIIPENAYTEFSDILEGRGVLRNAPNSSYTLTQKGIDMFCNVVATGVPPPTTTT